MVTPPTTQNLQPWARRALGGGLAAGLYKGVFTSGDGIDNSIKEGGELSILGGVTGILFPRIVQGSFRLYNNVREAAFTNPYTLRRTTRSITQHLPNTTTVGYFFETLYSLANTPQIDNVGQFFNHLVTHGWRDAAIGLGISTAPWVAYGIRRQVGERIYNYGHTRGWW